MADDSKEQRDITRPLDTRSPDTDPDSMRDQARDDLFRSRLATRPNDIDRSPQAIRKYNRDKKELGRRFGSERPSRSYGSRR